MPRPPSPPAALPVFAVKGETLEDYWDYTHRIFEWPDGGGPNMILDDGGDATLLMHLGMQAETNPVGDQQADQRGRGSAVRGDQATAEGQARLVFKDGQSHQGRDRRDDDRRSPSLSDGEGRPAAVPRYQCQRQRHQIEIRQSLRLPRVAGRRHPPRHRRHDGRQGGDGRGLRRCRQRLGGLAAPGRLPRPGLGDRSDLRAAGRDGRLRGRHHGGRGAARRHLRHRNRQSRRHHHRAHAQDEAPRHRLQHRSLRQRDPGRGAQEPEMAKRQAAGRRDRIPGRQAHHPACRKADWSISATPWGIRAS